MDDDDIGWIVRSKANDRAAFGKLVQRWYGPILALCQSKLSRRQDAEDAAQETFVRCYLRLGDLRDNHRFGGWIRGIAVHVCSDQLRRRQRQKALVHAAVENLEKMDGLDPSQSLESTEERQALVDAITALPEHHREVVLLHYYSQMTYDQMAEWLQVARATVQERLSQSRQSLRRQLMARWRSHP